MLQLTGRVWNLDRTSRNGSRKEFLTYSRGLVLRASLYAYWLLDAVRLQSWVDDLIIIN